MQSNDASLSMLQEANKITLCDVTTHQLKLVMKLYHHFSIRYKFYAAAQIETIIKTESASFGWTNVVWTYVVIFRVRIPRQCRLVKNYPGYKLPGTGTRTPAAALVPKTFLDTV